MKHFLLAAVFLSLSACKNKAPEPVTVPVKAVVAGLELIDYQEPTGTFEVQGPADWKVKEDDSLGPSVIFLGPGNQKYPRSVTISVSRYPNQVDSSPDPRKYYEGLDMMEEYRNLTPYGKRSLGGREVEGYSLEKPRRMLHERKIAYYVREDVAIIPIPGGFYRIDHVAPVDIYKETSPVFEAVVASFKPGPLPAAKKP